MFNAKQFRELIVDPVLKGMDAWTAQAADLLVMTMAHESNGGQFLKQLGKGPALGMFQMEKRSFDDLWSRCVATKPGVMQNIMAICNLGKPPQAEEMEGNLYLATAMARVYYKQVFAAIPNDLVEMSNYAKQYWNTSKGAATPQDYLRAYYAFEGSA